MLGLDLELVWPIVGAVIAGGLIGFEREYRGRPAGFRTHILVCLASALLMVAAAHQARWMGDTPRELIRIDPVRMAHGILTGVGFLCGGVIFRQGLNVHGLTTAASLWITSAVGVLFGVGFYDLAIGGAATTVVVLAGLNMTESYLPRWTHADLSVRYARNAGMTEAAFRQLMAVHGLKAAVVKQSLQEDGTTAFAGAFKSRGRCNLDGLAAALRADPQVVDYDLSPRGE